jgi:sialate O-acetylesterase
VKITGHQSAELHNVLVGDVWLCGGQSNMGLPLRFTKNADEEIKAANYPDIRFFTVGGHPAYHHVDVIDGDWRVVSPETASWISAVGYYFARKVEQEMHIPIGIVVDSVGVLRPRRGRAPPRSVRSMTSMSHLPSLTG